MSAWSAMASSRGWDSLLDLFSSTAFMPTTEPYRFKSFCQTAIRSSSTATRKWIRSIHEDAAKSSQIKSGLKPLKAILNSEPLCHQQRSVTHLRANARAPSRTRIESSDFRSRIGNRGRDDPLHDESDLGAIARPPKHLSTMKGIIILEKQTQLLSVPYVRLDQAISLSRSDSRSRFKIPA